ncbi:MAG: C45 family autoproteolytic acyltransferase/hydrolase [Peptostreptococcaceae bacterium]
MYHGRFKGTHYEAGYKWGALVNKNGIKLNSCPTYTVEETRIQFGRECKDIFEKYYPEIVEEVKGIAHGNETSFEYLCGMLFSMYCFEFDNKCTCFAINNKDQILFGRNSDFLVSLEKQYMNCIYKLDNVYSFNGNTTAFVQMEDGVNEEGLAVGLTFIYPKLRKPGFNAGILVRYILEKCKTTQEAITAIKTLPIASQQTITLADKNGHIAIVECNCEKVVIINQNDDEDFVSTANNFNTNEMTQYKAPIHINDWRSYDRYITTRNALCVNMIEKLMQILYGQWYMT